MCLAGVGQPVEGALVLRYGFDEASSGSTPALDSGTVAPAAPGTFLGDATRTPNTPGGGSLGAADFTGATTPHYVSAGDVDKLDGLSQFTLTTWLNLQADTAGNQRLLAKQSGGAFEGFSWGLAAPTAGTRTAANFNSRLFVGGVNGFVSAVSPDIGADHKWVFLAVTYDGTQATDNVKYYIGDETGAVAQLGPTLTANGGATAPSAAEFGVGFTFAAPTANTAPPGWMDDARVYDQVLDATALDGIRLANVPEPGMIGLGTLALGLILRRRR